MLPPGPKTIEFLKLWPTLRHDPIRVLMDLNERFGHILHFPLGKRSFTLATHPDAVKYVLKDNHRNYIKSANYQKLKPLLGNGLLTSEGEFWKRQRRIAQPIFHAAQISGFLAVMQEVTLQWIEKFRGYQKRDEVIDIAREMNQLTLEIVGRTLFDIDLSEHASRVGEALSIALIYANRQVTSLIPTPLWMPTYRNIRAKRAIQFLDQLVLEIIERKRREAASKSNGRLNFISLLLNARDEETGGQMNDEQLRDEAMTIFLAGHETTANALSFALLLISENPAIADQMKLESEKNLLAHKAPTLELLSGLPLTQEVFEETIRLYPPAWIIERNTIAADQIGGFDIPAQSMVFLSPFLTQRHKDFWQNPKDFDPGRFNSENKAKIMPFSYFPFGGGPRQCIGSQFALLEAKLILSLLIQNFQFEKVPDHSIELQAKVTLRPRHGILMRLH